MEPPTYMLSQCVYTDSDSSLISEVKEMKSDVLRALKASISEKKLWTLFVGSILTIFKEKKVA
jgi:hypothetical protein